MNENAKKWVAALRSGEYQQGMDALRDGDRFCCLGVACDVYRKATGDGEWTDMVFSVDRGDWDEWSSASLPDAVRKWIGLQTAFGDWDATPENEFGCLSGANDSGEPFAKIADIIESEPEGLFE